jgi:hypothetical protein
MPNNKLNNIKNYCTTNNIKELGVQIYAGSIIVCSLGGAIYSFYYSLKDAEYSDDTTITKTIDITGCTLFGAMLGFTFGSISPLLLPIAIPAYICVKYNE